VNLSDLALLVRGFSSERIAGAMLARASIAPAISGEASGSGLMGALGLKPFYDQCSVPIRAVSCSIANCDPTPDPGASMIALCFKLHGTSIGIRFGGGAFEREWVSWGSDAATEVNFSARTLTPCSSV
jgi:hypothetical protein